MQQHALPRDAFNARSVIHRLDDWNGLVNSAFENLTVDAARDGFEGTLDVRRFGDLDLSRVASSPAVVRRARPGGEPAAHQRYFKLHLQDFGASLNVQDGHEAVLRPGDLMLCDSSRPYSIRFDDPNRMLVLRLPEARVVARLGDPDAIVGRRLGVEGLGAAMLSAFVRNLWAAPLAPGETDCDGALLDAALNLLAAACGSGAAANDQGALQLKHRIKRFVDDNLRDPDLSVGRVAKALGVSPRYVQMVFAAMGTTPLAYIRRKRLQLAAEHLRRHGPDSSITDLSFSLGFNELSHFSRAFKARYGVGPREYRAG